MRISTKFFRIPAVLIVFVWFTGCIGQVESNETTVSKEKKWVAPPPLEPGRAIKYLKAIVDLGPRVSGSEAMKLQWKKVETDFRKLGAEVEFQDFEVRHPNDGSKVEMKNFVARYFPDRTTRVVICAHYDTRPFPDRDPKNPRGQFVGANDGASGVAMLHEMAHALPNLQTKVGVDLVLFDGEELIYDENRDRENYFLGAKHFALDYANGKKPYQYRAGILVDMIGDADLKLYYEVNSYQYAPKLVREVWGVAEKLKLKEFVPQTRHTVRDDHLSLNEIGRIPTIDIIDFDYPRPGARVQSYWHTSMDTPDKCSGESICKVAAVILEWLKQQ